MKKKTDEKVAQLPSDRLMSIDALRGLAMLLVVFGHSTKGLYPFYVFTSPVKMPLFFALSGYLMNVDREEGSFLKNIFFTFGGH